MRNLDVTGVDLGRGPRTLVRGGKLHTKYKIALPESFLEQVRDEGFTILRSGRVAAKGAATCSQGGGCGLCVKHSLIGRR